MFVFGMEFHHLPRRTYFLYYIGYCFIVLYSSSLPCSDKNELTTDQLQPPDRSEFEKAYYVNNILLYTR